MREDMRHVIIDRPRLGGDGGKSDPPKGSLKRWQRMPAEEYPKLESNSRGRMYSHDKRLNEHLGPLRRWLHRNCGRPWDDVYGEICEHLRVDSALQKHVRDHAREYVNTNTCVIDGKICDSTGAPLDSERRWSFIFRWRPFYVDPRDGTLRAAQPSSRRRKPPPPKFIRGEHPHQRYELLGGVWYEFRGEQVRELRLSLTIPGKKEVVWHWVWKKRQLGKREIRRLGLWRTTLGRAARAGV